MDAATNYESSSPPASLNSGGIESDFNKSSLSLKTSSGGDTFRDSESTGEILARYELDITYICEKLTNLNMLSMHVETMESEFEAVVSDMDSDMVVKALEYNLLSGYLSSEAKVLESHISDLKIEKANVREFLSSRKHLGEHLVGMEDMLCDSEKTLEQSYEQAVEIKTRSVNFERNFKRVVGDEGDTDSLNNVDVLELNERLKMQNVEHQRHILRMLEKSLGREIDLEKRVSELAQVEETLTMRVHMLERELNYAEDEAETALEKFYESDYSSDLLMETSRELLSKMKMLQFNLNGSVHRESVLKSDLQKLEKRVTEYEAQLVNEKPSGEEIVKMENLIKDLKEQVVKAENRVVNYEDKCRELNDADEKVMSLEKQLNDVKVKLQHADACNEASEEDNNMLRSTIKDMDNVIDDMKKKVAKSAVDFDSVEDKCVLLSESNADLKKELSFVRGRVICLETSLHQMEEAKNASAKDISLRSKFITDLVLQMAHERERLQKQISTLKQENFFSVKSLKKTEKGPDVKVIHADKASDFVTENKEALSTISEVEKTCNETVMQSTEKTIRNIDARQLKAKDILKVLLILIVPLLGVLLYQVKVR
ncbi:WPP domain-interacting tail-anchored protein 1-like [Rutidosis leptorrhynchoides]|uniref:WPP domain-interacting tail-anchored protein 1-like n=1 Tax=Rutidosis leptorrhynchoides TaxID=125765 RepID=UPI003A99D4EC